MKYYVAIKKNMKSSVYRILSFLREEKWELEIIYIYI